MTQYHWYDSPVGLLLLLGDERGLFEIRFMNNKQQVTSQIKAGWQEKRAAFDDCIAQLDAYFAGELTRFDLPLVYTGTDFQQQVMQALQAIPYGQTCSYGELAKKLGREGAARAVGAANRRNPLPIVVPCHRVIGASGALTGFSGGLDKKRKLLTLEGAL